MNIRGLKQVDLVNKTGISKASINQYVKGTHCPTNERAFLLSKVLRVNPAWLMGFDVEMFNDVNELNKGFVSNNTAVYGADKSEQPLTAKEQHFIEAYSQLSEEQQGLVDNLMRTWLSKQ